MSTLRMLAGLIARLSGAPLGYLSYGANSAGGWLAGALPHRSAGGKGSSYGLNAQTMMESGLKGYLMLGIEPEYDCADPAGALQAMHNAEFVVSLSSYDSDTMRSYANVILPVGPYSETSGTFVNAEGRWQSFAAAVSPLGNVRPAWKVLRVLGNLFDISGFDYVSSEEVRDEVAAAAGECRVDNSVAWQCPDRLEDGESAIARIADVPMYGVDPVVRRALALQQTEDAAAGAGIKIGAGLAIKLGLEGAEEVVARQGDNEVTVALTVDQSVPDGAVWLSSASPAAASLHSAGTPIELRRPS
jgi:NADH-quinone oxidoreductase subunit G